MGQHGQRQKACLPCLLRYVPAGVGDAVRQLHPLIMLDFIQFTLRHIPPQIQQFPDALCRFLPRKQCGAAALRRCATGNTHPFGVIPKRNSFSVKIEACAVFSVVPLQKCGVVRLILHKVGADDEPTVLVIGPNTKGFVNDLLGQLRMGEQRSVRRLGRQVKEGELLRVLWNKRLDAGIDEIFPLVNELRREACHQLPRKHALAGAGREGPFPHEQAVLLRVIAKP